MEVTLEARLPWYPLQSVFKAVGGCKMMDSIPSD